MDGAVCISGHIMSQNSSSFCFREIPICVVHRVFRAGMVKEEFGESLLRFRRLHLVHTVFKGMTREFGLCASLRNIISIV